MNWFAVGDHAATVLDYLSGESVFLFCEPGTLNEHAETYARQIPSGDPLFVGWEELVGDLLRRGMTVLEISELEAGSQVGEGVVVPDTGVEPGDASDRMPAAASGSSSSAPLSFLSLEVYRPLRGRAPEPQIAETQRREFFVQLHRWLRQGFSVHIFCNNDGERQRFGEIWEEYGLSKLPDRPDAFPALQVGSLARGFLCDPLRLVVVTDAEIFGRYKIQRPRRLKSPHAPAARSALQIDFTDLEEGDYVVHVQHGIGRFLGLKTLPVTSRRPRGAAPEPGAAPTTERGQECLVVEYAPGDPEQPPPKLYVPVTEAHLVSKYVGAGKARPPLNTLGGSRWAKTKAQAERAVRDLAGELLAIQAAREAQAGQALAPDRQSPRASQESASRARLMVTRGGRVGRPERQVRARGLLGRTGGGRV